MFVKRINKTTGMEVTIECRGYSIQQGEKEWFVELHIFDNDDSTFIVDKRSEEVYILNGKGQTVDSLRWGIRESWPVLDMQADSTPSWEQYVRDMFSDMGIYDGIEMIANILMDDEYSIEMSTSDGLVYPAPKTRKMRF